MEPQIVLLTVAIALQYSVFADDPNDDSPRFKRFKRLREPLLAEIKQTLLASAAARQLYARAKADNDQQSARAHAREAYQIDWKIQRLRRDVERLARVEVMATREETWTYISKLANTLAKEAFDQLRGGSSQDRAADEQTLLDSPDGAMYAVLYIDKCLRRPWPEAEAIIALDAEQSFHLAFVLGRRFLEGEKKISTESVLWERYCRHFSITTNHHGSAVGVDLEATEAEEEVEAEVGTIESLRDRTDDWTEDMEEREEIEQTLAELDNEDEVDSEAEQKETE